MIVYLLGGLLGALVMSLALYGLLELCSLLTSLHRERHPRPATPRVRLAAQAGA